MIPPTSAIASSTDPTPSAITWCSCPAIRVLSPSLIACSRQSGRSRGSRSANSRVMSASTAARSRIVGTARASTCAPASNQGSSNHRSAPVIGSRTSRRVSAGVAPIAPASTARISAGEGAPPSSSTPSRCAAAAGRAAPAPGTPDRARSGAAPPRCCRLSRRSRRDPPAVERSVDRRHAEALADDVDRGGGHLHEVAQLLG